MNSKTPEELHLYSDFQNCGMYWKSYDHTDVTADIPSHCIYCEAKLAIKDEPDWVLFCPNSGCGWWMHFPPPKPAGFRTIEHHAKWAIIKKFSFNDKDLPTAELAKYLKQNPHSMVNTHFSAFEKLVCSLMKEFYGPTEFIHVGRPKDGGKDLIGVFNDKITTFVEVKKRENIFSCESVRTVRNLLGVMTHEGVEKGIVVTTADRFSKEAHSLSVPKEESLANYNLELISFKDIKSWLNISRVSSSPSWEGVIEPYYCEDEYERDHVFVRAERWKQIGT